MKRVFTEGSDIVIPDMAEILLRKNKRIKSLEDTIKAIEIVLNLHYVEGDMTEKEAIDEICHLVHPESRPSSTETPT